MKTQPVSDILILESNGKIKHFYTFAYLVIYFVSEGMSLSLGMCVEVRRKLWVLSFHSLGLGD